MNNSENIDIVALIEKSPLTRFSKTYKSKFISKIQETFTEKQQQLYLTNFYCYLEYDGEKDFVINLDDVWKWIGYERKDSGKKILKKYFVENINYKIILNKIFASLSGEAINTEVITPQKTKAKNNEQKRGGHNKETILLTVDTFKELCLRINSNQGNEIRKYYIKLERLLNDTAKEESQELLEQLQLKDTQHTQELINKTEIDRHNVLLEKYCNVNYIVYIIKVKTNEDKSYIIKIGESSNGVSSRYKEHKRNYPEAIILDVFHTQKCDKFEKFLLNHPSIQCSKVKDLEGHEHEKELVLIGKDLTYKQLLEIVNNNISSFSYERNIEDEKQVELLKKENYEVYGSKYNEYKELNTKIDLVYNKLFTIEEIIKDMINENVKLKHEIKKLNPHENTNEDKKGGFIQQINPETFTLIKVFDTATECIRELNLNRTSLRNSIENNTLYNGYRWNEIDRTLDPNVINNIQPTKETKQYIRGYIAKLNDDKTEILNIYIDRKTAAKLNGYPNETSLDTAVKQQNISKGNYYLVYDMLTNELKENFDKPILYTNGIGKFDLSGNLVKEYYSRDNCSKLEEINTKTLNKRIQNEEEYNGFVYKQLPPKLHI